MAFASLGMVGVASCVKAGMVAVEIEMMQNSVAQEQGAFTKVFFRMAERYHGLKLFRFPCYDKR
jgi:hypothetical protein